MSKMNEQSQQEDERENLSGSDDYEAYMYEQNAEHRASGAPDCQTDFGFFKRNF